MHRRYDLQEMKEEIRRDEQLLEEPAPGHATQDAIRQMVERRKKKGEVPRE